MLALGRLYRDSEMTALFACGVGLKYIFKPAHGCRCNRSCVYNPVDRMGNPWAARYEQQLKAGLQDRSALEFLTAGKFVETIDGDGVFFIQSGNKEKTKFKNIFLHRETEDGTRQVKWPRKQFSRRTKKPAMNL